MLHYFAGQLVGMGMGFVVGAFTPSITRKIKALFVKETKSAESAVMSKVDAVKSDIAKKI